ncbi:Beta-lactamase superfamily domain-containing protein [Desulfonatronum thiosulfatophilum]|uniref:Beta-lactamase superfamily domain-containing protein n=1 Tax=Desulfonatronum thiosulfatophilum TaxID=617002 RepID=A0A1G6BDG9_9BACT|nr:3',5'-cyclic-nucleotide phosphodiesterase [Desulfonatronum thiosulfatophilum]SDB18655.1 Beta-lactamase superfamily domain-containing protein [Desulfonatronum thiosulfatophilum]
MHLHVLGCSGSDLPGYNLTSFLVNKTLLLDAGSVTSSLSSADQAQIQDILVTHAHLDHIKDILFLADNLIELVVRNEHGPVRIRALAPVLDSIRTHLLNDTIWPDFTVLPAIGNPVLTYNPLEPGVWVDVNGLQAATFPVNHAKAASGYVLREESSGANFAFTGDTGPTSDWWHFLNGLPFSLEHLIIEASFPNSMEELALLSQHLTPALLRVELDKLHARPKIYISHMKSTFSSEIQEQLNQALDGYTYHLLRDGEDITF